MSGAFDLNSKWTQDANDALQAMDPVEFEKARWNEGAFEGLTTGFSTGTARVEYNNAYSDEYKQKKIDAIEKMVPNPNTVGAVGQILNGLADQLTTYGLSASSDPVSSLFSAGTTAMIDAVKAYSATQKELHQRQGIDAKTAEEVSRTEGTAFGLGLVMPASLAGKTAFRVATGAALNTGVGMVERGMIGHTLDAAGYKDMAAQYRAFDGTAIGTDLLLGGFFGGLMGERAKLATSALDTTAPRAPIIKPSDIDAILTQNSAKHAEIGTAPGIPTDFQTRQAHVDNLTNALNALINGEEFNATEGVTNGNFMEDPTAVAARTQIAEAVREHVGDLEHMQGELEQRGLPTDPTLYNITSRIDLPPIRAKSELSKLAEQAVAEGWTTQQLADRMNDLVERMNLRDANKDNASDKDRVRGRLWIEQKLTEAERLGRLDSEQVRLAKWLIGKNPNIANDLAISLPSALEGAAGQYEPIQRLATVVRNNADPLTAVHEFLHHGERLMPDDIRHEIQKAWAAEVKRVTRMAEETGSIELKTFMQDVLQANLGKAGADERLKEMIRSGSVDPSAYALVNPSEYWAVNASKIIRERASESWVKRAWQWIKELAGRIQNIFGLNPDAALSRGIDALLKSDGRVSGLQLATNAPRLNMEVSNFQKFFGRSKVVDAAGKPMAVYHASVNPITEFKPKSYGTAGEHGFYYFSTAESWATRFARDELKTDKPAVHQVYLAIENPLDLRGMSNTAQGWADFLKARGVDLNDTFMAKVAAADPKREIAAWQLLRYDTPENGALRESMKAAGFDGIVMDDVVRGKMDNTTWVAFDPNQIKSATDNNGEYSRASNSILQNVEAPGKGVAKENLNGFEPDLRVKVPGKMALPEKPLILTGTNLKNAARQIAAIDDILAKFPDADINPLEWSKMMAYAMATNDVPIPPYRFLKDINSDGAFKSLSRLSAGQIADAAHGFQNAAEFRQSYLNKELKVATTGKLFMWSFLSRGVSPYTQEGLFIDAFPGVAQWINKAAAGEFTEADFPAYEKWAKSVAPQGSGQPGSGATHNLNAFGKLFLYKMGQKDENGVSLLQTMHNMMEDPEMTGQQLRRWFISNTEGVGIDNKVVSFTMLVAGFDDVMVLDRVQIRQLWDDGRFNGRNLYDGRKEDGKPVAGSALSEISYGARGLLIYEAIERALAKRIENIYASLGRPEDASVGRYHWETWVADSQQEASHGTLDAILHDAKGNEHKIAEVTAKEGEYGAYAYGARYGRDAQGVPYFLYNTPLGSEYRFDVPAFREFMGEVKSPKNKVVPSGFKVTEAGNAPWYEQASVNKHALEQLAQRYSNGSSGSEGAGALRENGQGQAVPDQSRSGGGADPYAPEELMRNAPALTYIAEDGTMVSAARALAIADDEIATAQRDSLGFGAAVACALRG